MARAGIIVITALDMHHGSDTVRAVVLLVGKDRHERIYPGTRKG